MNSSDSPCQPQTSASHLNPVWMLSRRQSLVITAPSLSSDSVLMDSAPAPRQTPVGPPGRARTACLLYFGHYSICPCCAYILSRPRAPPSRASHASAATTAAHGCRRRDKRENTPSLLNKCGTKMNEGASLCK